MESKKTISALTLDIKEDGWEKSYGFTKREVAIPKLDQEKIPKDRVSVILKLKYAGVCGSDKGIWHRKSFKDLIFSSLKDEGVNTRILGHEFLGEIVEMGNMVSNLYSNSFDKERLKIGSLVSGDSHITCGKCYQCKIGEGNVCVNEAILGISINGIFSEYVKIPAKNLWVINSEKIRPEIASILDPFGNAVHAATKVDLKGQQVAIFGAGPIGLFSLLLAKNFGATKIIVVDINKNNLKMAKDLGAHETILIDKNDGVQNSNPEIISKIIKLTENRGADVSLEMAGPASSINNALQSTRRGGHVVLFGLKDGDMIIPKFSRIITQGLTLHGIIGREIFKTWQLSESILSDKSNGIQDAIWKVILKEGKGTILDFKDYTPDKFEDLMEKHPKIILKF